MIDPTAQLAALADPRRRQIFEMLSRRPQAVGVIAIRLPISRPAVSQHLKVLVDAGLVKGTAAGTKRIYSVDPSGLEAIRGWVDAQWEQALDAFEKAAVKQSKETNR